MTRVYGPAGSVLPTPGSYVQRDGNGNVTVGQARAGIVALLQITSGFSGLTIDTTNGAARANTIWNAIAGYTPFVITNTAILLSRVSANRDTIEFWLDLAGSNDKPNTAGMALGLTLPDAGALTSDLIFSAFAGGVWGEVARLLNAGGLKIGGQSTVRSGLGVPANGLGVDGDYYFRSDGGGAGATHLYYRNAAAYIGIA